jgi:hypothetical protein
MKTKQIVIAAMLILTTLSFSHAQTKHSAHKQFTDAEMAQIDMRYARALSHSNDGVVESALAAVTLLKLDLPENEFPMSLKQVSYLSTHSDTPKIRYRASLAEAVFWAPEKYKLTAPRLHHDADEFFSALEDATTTQIMSSK